MRCESCARKDDPEEKKRLLRAHHEALGGHEWKYKKHAQCTLCDAEPAFECLCGAIRCERHSKRLESSPNWRLHPLAPAPFQVIDQQKIPVGDKLERIKMEVGADADLPTFAECFLKLFGDKVRGGIKQKGACLDLYTLYNPACKYKREVDLEPALLEEFQRVWDPEAPSRCRACSKAIPRKTAFHAKFCGEACAAASGIGKPTTCRCGCTVFAARGQIMQCTGCRDILMQPMVNTAELIGLVHIRPKHEKREAEPAWKRRRHN